jgi:hypothetical protein
MHRRAVYNLQHMLAGRDTDLRNNYRLLHNKGEDNWKSTGEAKSCRVQTAFQNTLRDSVLNKTMTAYN